MRNRHLRQDAGLVLLAIAVRAAAVLILQSHHVPRSTYEHGEIAANLLAGHGFSVRFLGALGPDVAASTHLSGPGRLGLRGRRCRDAGGPAHLGTGPGDSGRPPRTGRAAPGTRGGAASTCGQHRGRPDRGAPSHARLRRNARPGFVARGNAFDMDTCVCIQDRGQRRQRQRANHWGLACGGDIVRPDPRAGRGGRSLGHCAGQVRSKGVPAPKQPGLLPWSC